MIFCRWISVGSDLKFDARRDLDDMGASFIPGMLFGFVNLSQVKFLYIKNPLQVFNLILDLGNIEPF